MLNFNAHLGFQFTEKPFLKRFEAAASAGFSAVEFPIPYDHEPSVLFDLLQEHQLSMVQFAAPVGLTKGLAAATSRDAEFRGGLVKAVEYANRLQCCNVHLMSGMTIAGALCTDGQTYLDNLHYAVDYLADHGIKGLIEVISATEMPGYYLCNFDLAEPVLEAIPELGLIMDVYHAQLVSGDGLGLLKHWIDRIHHVQVADWPGRHEPGTGRLKFAQVFSFLQRVGYEGWIGCEYRPLIATNEGLSWLNQWGVIPKSSLRSPKENSF
ncbi:TIM barrel protein [Pseudomonas sp. 21LCFQ010]|uniref:hydroxypyruvate isomerase family protein n=1 Tax=Pseudomonas sp. 21LCFQ010 TaxID=2957506 RepID=UPI0020973F37|nr:TIM barrel protein [Pseudomonas sp. 21LCFQ010]MCO8166130.1 TIM barrel protein [Pseudomonas sp. 21LCFQ010]